MVRHILRHYGPGTNQGIFTNLNTTKNGSISADGGRFSHNCFLYNTNYCTDTILDTINIYDTTFTYSEIQGSMYGIAITSFVDHDGNWKYQLKDSTSWKNIDFGNS